MDPTAFFITAITALVAPIGLFVAYMARRERLAEEAEADRTAAE